MSAEKEGLPFHDFPAAQPGDSLFDEQLETLIGRGFMAAIAAVMFICYAASEWIQFFTQSRPNPLLFSIIAICVSVPSVVIFFRSVRKAKTLRLAIWGERYVGAMLEGLRALGCEVVHDIAEKGFNVDHVVVGPGGIYTVETKTRSKPKDDRDRKVTYDGQQLLVHGLAPDRDPIAQARAQADHVRSIIRDQCGEDVPVQPTVTYPGWYVVNTAPRSAPVWVLNEKVLMMRIREQPTRLSEVQVRAYANALRRHERNKYRSNK